MRKSPDLHICFLPSWYPAQPSDLSGNFFREQAIALKEVCAKVGVVAASLRSLRNLRSALSGGGGIRKEVDEGVLTYRSSALHLTPRLWGPTIRRVGGVAEHMFECYVADNGVPDVIHVHAALPIGGAAIKISQKYRVPFVYSEHSTAFARNLVGPAGMAEAKRVAVRAIRRFAVSRPFALLLEDSFGFSRGTFEIMPNPVHSRFLERELSKSNQSGIRFLHVSLLDPKKNVTFLLQAFADAFRGRHDALLTIGGDGSTKPTLVELAAKLGVSAQVRFLGALSREGVATALSEADVFVLPSKFETFGVVLVEALAMGVPVIATRCGGPEDIVATEDGILVPVDDVAALARAMVQMEATRETWDRAILRDRCRNRFAASSIARQWLEVYGSVVGCGSAAA